jgi:hypothetical protein
VTVAHPPERYGIGIAEQFPIPLKEEVSPQIHICEEASFFDFSYKKQNTQRNSKYNRK